MNFRFNRPIRIISVIVLFSFLWTFGGLFEIAYAFKNSQQNSLQSTVGSRQSIRQTPEERFEKALERLTEAGERAGERLGKGEDIEDEEVEIKKKRSEVENLDTEIRKQFKDTEEKIKDLPEVIKQRHRDFVRKYEENLNTLRINLDEIEKAKTKEEKENAHKKTKDFLEKTKPPKKHIPLDPNKLPHRTPEVEKKEPRLKPEQFRELSTVNREPVLVASAGSLAGLLSSTVIQATDQPTPADLSETIEVQFTPEIKAKAAELNYNPVKIYNWVRNNIEFVPTYGSIQGANMCLQTKQCNAFDTASLLIALLRASGIHARYAYGTVEIPIEKVKNWLGGFTDSMTAINLLASAGIPTKGMIVGSEVKYARIEHVWVETYIDYIPSRGARHKTGQGDTWIPLDASFKQYNYTQGIDIKSAVPFDAQLFIDQIKSTATINETEGYVTNVNSTLIQQTTQDYQTRVQNYINQNYPNATVGDVLGKKEIIKQEFPILLGTLPYNDLAVGWKISSLPDNLRHKIAFNVTKDMYDEFLGTPINITKSLPELAGKKITLSYSPATSQDEAVINSYLPQPHPDGTPIQPNELPTSLPAYLINLKPELRIDGVVAAAGTLVGMGTNETFTMTFSGPGTNYNDVITNDVKAGNYLGIAFDLSRISSDQMLKLKSKLSETRSLLQAKDYSHIKREDIIGDLLFFVALYYLGETGITEYMTSKYMDVVSIKLPSETIFSFDLRPNYAFGIPISVMPNGFSMDADRLITLVKSLDSNRDKEIQFMQIIGIQNSAFEHVVPQQILPSISGQPEGISAVKALQNANNQGIPIYTVDQSNLNSVLPQLQVDSGTITDIKNAVNAGNIVTVSKTDIAYNGFAGCGYIVIDPETGAGGYMISGGGNGALFLFSAQMTEYISYGVEAIIGIPVGIELAFEGYLLSEAELKIAKNYSPTPENCAHYDVEKIYEVCMNAGDWEWANIARYGLKKDFLQQGYSAEWVGKTHAKWFMYAALIIMGVYDR